MHGRQVYDHSLFFSLSPLCPCLCFYMVIYVPLFPWVYVGVWIFLAYFGRIYLCDIHLYLPVRCLFHSNPPSPSVVLLLLYPRILISLSWCSTPGLSCGQIAALFISLVINITHCTATFAGNNTDNGALALLSLFFSPPCSFLLPASLL